MFIRRKRMDGSRTKVQIVKSVRTGDKVRQRVLRHVGTAHTAEERVRLEGMAGFILEEIKTAEGGTAALFTPREPSELTARRAAPQRFGVDIADCRHAGRMDADIREVFGSLYGALGWDRLFGARCMSANRIVKELVLARLAQPLSKRATVRELEGHGALALNLDLVYRSMDRIDDALIDRIRKRSFEAAQTLLAEPVTALFHDTTTLYFESERDDALRAKGYSKDGKPHRVQVLFALLITPDGLPVGYELFPGNTYEGNTLVVALERLERHHVHGGR